MAPLNSAQFAGHTNTEADWETLPEGIGGVRGPGGPTMGVDRMEYKRRVVGLPGPKFDKKYGPNPLPNQHYGPGIPVRPLKY